ncbi:hypothetical protein [Naasia lichenicola]|uniref:Uncharacterized protein n=1 Tax=Naasia lichenicola TaxID=2565933 RepID=A0A4S4FKX0_9MICO|nr:hypothetical protein [Naasia lichenicola]THG30674.1 hypothetical protein E6C64_08520 [Naasia lichenicola]THG31911.1 hypothetical protein E6C64_07665 [Naasia lichenicola]
MANRLQQINGADTNSIIRTSNSNFAKLDLEVIAKSFGGDRMTIGKMPNGDYGFMIKGTDGNIGIYGAVDSLNNRILKVAKPGKDALSTNPSDIAFDLSA